MADSPTSRAPKPGLYWAQPDAGTIAGNGPQPVYVDEKGKVWYFGWEIAEPLSTVHIISELKAP